MRAFVGVVDRVFVRAAAANRCPRRRRDERLGRLCVGRLRAMMSRHSSQPKYGALACNLCWEELKEPFIVTSCNHCFCMHHEKDERILQQTCPGCNSHLPAKGGKHPNT